MSDWTWAVHLVDAVIALTLIEAVALLLYRRATGKGVAAREFVVNLLSGLCLMLALRAALGGAPPLGVLPWLAAAGLAHAADLWRRWQH